MLLVFFVMGSSIFVSEASFVLVISVFPSFSATGFNVSPQRLRLFVGDSIWLLCFF